MTNLPTNLPFVKMFAAPGIDSHPAEHGCFNSGAGFDPSAPTMKTPPYDWGNESPTQNHGTGCLIGNFEATRSPDATSLKIRRRGIDPWGGPPPTTGGANLGNTHPGGITDMNPGSASTIAGGTGHAPTMCHVNLKKTSFTRGMKLPVMPSQAMTGGRNSLPSGGGFGGSLAAPIRPSIPGWTTIFSFSKKAKA